MVLTEEQHTNAQRATGLGYIFATAVIWTASSFISQSLVSDDPCSAPKDKQDSNAIPPFVLTYLATSLFVVYLPIVYSFRCAQAGGVKAFISRVASSGTAWELETVHTRDSDDAALLLPNTVPSITSIWAKEDREAFWAALWAFPLWFCAQWLFNQSLAWTSVTSNTILSSTSSLFAFLLSLWVLGEQYTTRKLLCVMLCIGGTALVTVSDDKQAGCPGAPPAAPGRPTTAVLGDLMAVASAALYGAYTVLMRKQLPDEATANVALFFGYIGLFAFVVFAPVVVLMVLMGTFLPTYVSREAYGMILLEGALDYVLADYLWARAVLLIGPTIATLGLSVQIPVATSADLLLGSPAWIHRRRSIATMVSGTGLILLGFFGVNTAGAAAHPAKAAAETPAAGGGGTASAGSSVRGEGDYGPGSVGSMRGEGALEPGARTPLSGDEAEAGARGLVSEGGPPRQGAGRKREASLLAQGGSSGEMAALLPLNSTPPSQQHSPGRQRRPA